VARKRTRQTQQSKESIFESRLDLIRRRHRELILTQRQLIAADLADEFGDGFAGVEEAEELEYAGAGQTEMA